METCVCVKNVCLPNIFLGHLGLKKYLSKAWALCSSVCAHACLSAAQIPLLLAVISCEASIFYSPPFHLLSHPQHYDIIPDKQQLSTRETFFKPLHRSCFGHKKYFLKCLRWNFVNSVLFSYILLLGNCPMKVQFFPIGRCQTFWNMTAR